MASEWTGDAQKREWMRAELTIVLCWLTEHEVKLSGAAFGTPKNTVLETMAIRFAECSVDYLRQQVKAELAALSAAEGQGE